MECFVFMLHEVCSVSFGLLPLSILLPTFCTQIQLFNSFGDIQFRFTIFMSSAYVKHIRSKCCNEFDFDWIKDDWSAFVNDFLLLTYYILGSQMLKELGVVRLVLPAIPTVLKTWTSSFGFSKMSESERLDFLDYTFLGFQGTTLCQKILINIPVPTSTLKPPTGTYNSTIYIYIKMSCISFWGN